MKAAIFSVLFLVSSIRALDNGLAFTPPMGWMTWERFRCITDCEKYPKECISENLIMETADVMVSEGYLDAGYEYVNIDDCWSELERDENGKIVADKKRFPRGIKFLSDYVHSKGLKFGTYLDYGTKTCAGYPGSIDHLEIDAQSLADWGVDFIKMDGCNVDNSQMVEGYIKFGELMNKTGRPIMYSCSWPAYFEYYRKPPQVPDYEILKKTCNLWRNWIDIEDSWESVKFISDYFAENQDRVAPHAGNGHWNDPDTLLHGNYGLSYDQSKAQLAVWAILAAPFLLSTDLRTIKPEMKELILNRDIIAVNQDSLGIQGRRVNSGNGIEAWARKIMPIVKEEHSYAIAFVSRRTDGHPHAFNVTLKDLQLTNKFGYIVKDLFNTHRATYQFLQTDEFEERVNPTGANFYKFIPIE
ncbi:CLUMA_CG000061, isoform A [Clunio marinus]|uniref:Alpha-galactosidase n=1 Tax=Clunio marinus TaxID=568069 RepID=A0A1J1HJ44_9DIPT|nr:CLUMA_CG000061, isoform A [Clunio marinus]